MLGLSGEFVTLRLTCPRAACSEHNPLNVTHCLSCGKALLPVSAPAMRRQRCIYCGRMTQGATCPAHRGLMAKDPLYAEGRA